MKNLTKALVGTVAAGAMAASSAAPAFARDSHGGVDTGDVIAGALVIGGIAAIAAVASNKDHDGNSYGRSNDRNYARSGGVNPRQAVTQCVNAAERNASRYSYGRADVTDIRSVKNTRNGYVVKGRIAVNTSGHAWNKGDRLRGNGWNGDYRGWNNSLRGYDSGKFTCKIEYGRVVDLDYSGIRGL